MPLSRRQLLTGVAGLAAAGGVGGLAAREPGVVAATPSPPLTPVPTRWQAGWHAGFNHAHVHRPDQGYGSAASRVELQRLVDMGATHLFLTPFGYQPDLDGPEVRFGGTMDQTLTDEHLLEEARQARSLGLQVAMKPHVWSNAFWGGGKSRQDIAMKSQADWEAWFAAMGAFTEHYARLAQQADCALFCVGLEYLEATRQCPGAWGALARRLRSVYGGPLTYAANWWEELDRFADWGDFDFIGVNAYHPLSKAADPTVEQLLAAWQPHLKAVGKVAVASGKPVLLTEAGLRTIRGAAAQPWDHGTSGVPDPELQARAYEALLRAFTPEDWFAGVYWWKSFTTARRNASDDFTPVGKPAEEVLRRWWT